MKKINIPPNIFAIWTRLEVLLGLQLFGHTTILTKTCNLIDEFYKGGDIQEQQNRNVTLIGMDIFTHEEHLSQPLHTNKGEFNRTVTFLAGQNGIFNVTNKNKKFYLTTSINDDDFNVVTIVAGAYELESLDNEVKRSVIKEAYFTEESNPFAFKTNF